MLKLTLAKGIFLLSALGATAALGGGCSAVPDGSGAGDPGEDTSTYPPIGGDARHLQAGPILATPKDAVRGQRLDYHRRVVDFHKFSYTVSEVGPSKREPLAITGYKKSGKLKPTGHKIPRGQLPAQLDQRKNGIIPPIRDQGNCGSCWAFGTVAAVEAAVAIAGKGVVDLSEQLVLDCNNEGYSCGGGDFSFDVLKQPGGAPEGEYPYEAYDDGCRSSNVSHPYAIDSYGYKENPSIEDMKSAIQQYGAIGVTMAVCGSFPGYSGGVYDSPECNWEGANHIVALVGWDDTIPHSQGKGAWLLRNSWGESWGDNGYAWVAYGMAGLEQVMTFAVYAGGAGPVPGGGGTGGGGGGGGGTGGSDPGPDPGPGPGPVGGCSHDACTAGEALDGTCDLCVLGLCLADSYCCESEWDDMCVLEAGLFCGCN